MNFRSDNEAPVHRDIMDALAATNRGSAAAYGDDDWTARLDDAFSTLFDTDCRVVPLVTGTAGNSITLAGICPPWGGVFCHRAAHIANDEGGAPEFFTGGAKLVPLEGDHGKLDPGTLAAAIESSGVHGVHNFKPAALSLTQATECGTCYTPDQVRNLTAVARERHLAVHMDGARFANAVARLGCHPAELTWRAGVDALVFGASKNGALAAEAIVVFGRPDWLEGMERRRKRGGHLLSKMRYVSAQLLAMLEHGLWLRLAAHANAMADRLAAALADCPEARLAFPVEANEVFVRLPPERIQALRDAGAAFHLWPGSTDLLRLVCSWATDEDELEAFARALHAGRPA